MAGSDLPPAHLLSAIRRGRPRASARYDQPMTAPTPTPAPVLLTGVAGFIGSHTAAALLRRGVPVVGVDNLDGFYEEDLKRRNLEAVRVAAAESEAAFAFERADIRDRGAMEGLYRAHGVGSTIHLAARAGVRPSIAEPALYASVNVEGTSTLLDIARSAHPRGAFTMASSSSVYGNNEKVPFAETDDVNAPISPYAATKRACELIAHTFHHLYGLPVSCLRFFTVFGPRQRPDLAIAKFLRMAVEDRPLPVFGDGSTSRDYTYIDDIVAGVLAAHERIHEHGYRIWNLGGDRPVTLAEMVATIGRVVGREPRIARQPMQPGDVERTFADLTRSRAELGYAPTTPFEEGVRRQFAALSAASPAA